MKDGNIATAVVVMGPSGVGKTTVAEGIAETLGWRFAEADEFHPQANIAKMTAGTALADEDRWPWLRAIRDWIDAQAEAGENVVVTCSALKRSYRDLLRGSTASVCFVFLTGDPAVIARRIGHRTGHFMPASLLNSQFADLEPLQRDENGATITVDAASPDEVVHQALRELGLDGQPPQAGPPAAKP